MQIRKNMGNFLSIQKKDFSQCERAKTEHLSIIIIFFRLSDLHNNHLHFNHFLIDIDSFLCVALFLIRRELFFV